MADKMAAHHTGEVRLETGGSAPDPPVISERHNMRQTTGNNLGPFFKNNFIFSLRRQQTSDINPIAKIIAFGSDQRHCSTTFYV
ncbi:MAG: hypothetical protein KKA31_00410 [Candidatus Margulisbacteria bacterium]|nr:hypothetical protein [Candidatus Margulisiibacteriota bacterium]